GPRRGNGPRPRRRLCGWAHRPARHARDGRVLLLSRRPPRPRHRGRARAEPRPRDPRRRGGLHADLRPRRPRPRPRAQGARVRRGDARPRRERPRRGPPPHPPEPRLGAHRAGEHRAVVGRPHRGLALLPRALRPAADALVGGDAERGPPEPRAGAAPRRRAGPPGRASPPRRASGRRGADRSRLGHGQPDPDRSRLPPPPPGRGRAATAGARGPPPGRRGVGGADGGESPPAARHHRERRGPPLLRAPGLPPRGRPPRARPARPRRGPLPEGPSAAPEAPPRVKRVTSGLLDTPAGFGALLLAYLVVHLLLRVLVSRVLTIDDAREAVLGQTLAWGYQARQPPLYNWLVWGTFRLVGVSVLSLTVVKYAVLGTAYAFVYASARRILPTPRLATLATFSLLLVFPV